MKKSHLKILRVAEDNRQLRLKLLLETWNHPHPHFGGDSPHRYDFGETTCAYCYRPMDWTPVNAGVVATDLEGV